jgi:hypothetical protein
MKNSLIQKYNVPGQDILAIQQLPFWQNLVTKKNEAFKSIQNNKGNGISIYSLAICEKHVYVCGCFKITKNHSGEKKYVENLLKNGICIAIYYKKFREEFRRRNANSLPTQNLET